MYEDVHIILYWLLFLIAGYATGKLLRLLPKSSVVTPPGLPVLGNAVALGKLGVSYINACRRQYGDVFTLGLASQYMTFWFDPCLIDTFFKAPDNEITFRPAVEQFTQRVFGLPSKEFFPQHSRILSELRHLLVPGVLADHAQRLGIKVLDLMPQHFPSGVKVDLYAATKQLVFQAAVEVLFGKRFLQMTLELPQQLQTSFFEFENGFEMAASPVPHFLQPSWVAARKQLLGWFQQAHQAGLFQGTVVGDLLDRSGLRAELAPHLLLSLLWASQANTVPATFWTLAFLLLPENQQHLAGVLTDLQQELAAAADGSDMQQRLLTAAYKLSTDRKSLISRCVAEAVRLRAPSIDVRIAAVDLELTTSKGEKVSIPKGRILAVCPFEIHHDMFLYPPDAWSFNPDHKQLQIGDGTSIVPSISGLSFGGGSYRCPGRFFAEMELGLIVQLILYHHELQLVHSSVVAGTDNANGISSSGGGSSIGGGSGGRPMAAASADQQPAANKAEQPEEEEQQQLLLPLLLAPLLKPAAQWLLGPEVAAWGLGMFDASAAAGGSSCNSSGCGGNSSNNPPASTSAAMLQQPAGKAASGNVHNTAELPLPIKLEEWHISGDPHGLLPGCALQKLVGIKVPAGKCWVSIAKHDR